MTDILVYFYIIAPAVIVLLVLRSFWRRGKSKKDLIRSLDYVLYEITLPQEKLSEGQSFKDTASLMSKFYAGMLGEEDYFTLEIGLPEKGNEVVFYASILAEKSQLFEKQLQGLFPRAQAVLKKGDYNIFKPAGVALGAAVTLKEPYVLPVKTFDKFESDPLALLINTFSKLKKEGEGAAFQLILSRADDRLQKKIISIAKKVKEGESVKKAVKGESHIIKDIFKALWYLFAGHPKIDEKEDKLKSSDDSAAGLIEEKTSSQIIGANIRIIASGETKERALSILKEIESAFLQFADTRGNKFEFSHLEGKKLKDLIYRFSFRVPCKEREIFLSANELATVFHFPYGIEGVAAPQLKYAKTKEAASPLNLPQTGVILGKNIYRGAVTEVRMSDDDRRRHLYVIGQTGTGKSTVIKNMVVQDIEAGKGVCFIDPHGSDLQDILSRVPRERMEDVVYFNPGDTARPMGLNMLEYDTSYPEQKTFVVNELLGIFNKLFDMKTAGGPMFEQYFRNSAMLVMDDPASGNTLFEIVRVLSDKEFRDHKLSKTANPMVTSFWRDVAEKAGGEGSLQNIVPYITSKFDNFLSNDIMRPIIGQEKSAFNFREIMDTQKILLVNLSKGRLGDLNSSLIGLIIVGKLLMASLSRVDMPEKDRKDFYLYIDEFQNVTTDSIATILSEARKYRLNLNIAHQFIGQLEESIKKSVFGNVGSMAIFRVGAEDAEFLEKQLTPVFNAYDVMNIDNYNAYMKLLVAGQTARPFNVLMYPFERGDDSFTKDVIALSSQKYGRPRDEVENEIKAKYNKTQMSNA